MSVAKSCAKDILFAIVGLSFLFAPVNLLIKVAMGMLAVFTPTLELAVSKKGVPWTLLLFLWRGFFEPLFRFQVVAIGFLSLIPTETVATWGLPTYFTLVPIAVLILKRWLSSTCSKLIQFEKLSSMPSNNALNRS